MVMYAGRARRERGRRRAVRRPETPLHRGLLGSIPRPDRAGPPVAHSGDHAGPHRMPSGCSFHPRCPSPRRSYAQQPPLVDPETGDGVGRLTAERPSAYTGDLDDELDYEVEVQGRDTPPDNTQRGSRSGRTDVVDVGNGTGVHTDLLATNHTTIRGASRMARHRQPLLSVENLRTSFYTDKDLVIPAGSESGGESSRWRRLDSSAARHWASSASPAAASPLARAVRLIEPTAGPVATKARPDRYRNAVCGRFERISSIISGPVAAATRGCGGRHRRRAAGYPSGSQTARREPSVSTTCWRPSGYTSVTPTAIPTSSPVASASESASPAHSPSTPRSSSATNPSRRST